jgi:hypothetical protein
MGTHTSHGEPHASRAVPHPLRTLAFVVVALCTLPRSPW